MSGFKLCWSLLNLTPTVTGCVSISSFSSLVGIPVGISGSTATITTFIIIAGIKKYKSMVTKKKKKHDRIVLLAKTKLDTVDILISKAFIDSEINPDELVSVNIVLKE